MTDVRAILRSATSGRVVVAALALAALAGGLWNAEQRRIAYKQEVRWLEQRLAEKRGIIARQRAEMAEVASAVERLTLAATPLRDRTTQVRRAAHMEESREVGVELAPVKSTLDGGRSILSEDAARALAELSWLEGQTAATSDSLAVLNAVLQPRRERRLIVPTLWPVRGNITSRFGPRQSPYGDGPEVHPGIDIQAAWGVPVTAGGDGKVIFSGRDSGYGGLVVIDHGGNIDTYYGHLSAMYVREGQPVRRGQPIGAVGATGRATGAHLHYEVRVHGTPVDPTRYLARAGG